MSVIPEESILQTWEIRYFLPFVCITTETGDARYHHRFKDQKKNAGWL